MAEWWIVRRWLDGRAIAVATRRMAQSRESGRARVVAAESDLDTAIRGRGTGERERQSAHTMQFGLIGQDDVAIGRGGLCCLGALGSFLEL